MRRVRNIRLNGGAAKEKLFERSDSNQYRSDEENCQNRSIFDDLNLSYWKGDGTFSPGNGNGIDSNDNTTSDGDTGYKSRPQSPDSTTRMLESSLDTFGENPDDLSSSSSSSLSTLDEMAEGLNFSIPSNIFFFVGSVVFLILAKIDLEDGEYYYSQQYFNDDGNGDDIVGDDDSYSWSDPYTILSVVGAGAFIVNPMVDIMRCFHYKKRNPEIHSLWHESLRSDAASAFLFGFAAMIDLWAALPINADDAYDQVETASLISTHIYLLSAVAAVMGFDFRCCSGMAVMLGLVGDLLFLIGSVIDVSISYVSDPLLISMDPKVLLKLSLLSSSLWLIDSILYLLSDLYVLLHRRRDLLSKKKQEEEEISPSDMEVEYYNDELPDWFVWV